MIVLKQAIQTPSYEDQIVELAVGERAYTPYEKRTTIAPLISRIKREHRGRNYKTSKVNIAGANLLEIQRTA